jgi:transglutaminase-like putative cysteine protease
VVTLGGLASLMVILVVVFFRRHSFAGFLPTADTLDELRRLMRRAGETVVSESSPVAPNVGIVLVACACLGLVVVLMDALAVPLGMPATSGVGLLAILVVPATIKPLSVGPLSFLGAAVGYLLILAVSQRYAPDTRVQEGSSGRSGHARRAAATGAVALAIAVTAPLAIPGFDRGAFPQGSRLNPWGPSNGLNPMITLGNSLRNPSGEGRITYVTSSNRPLYLRSVTIDRFEGETWGPEDRSASRLVGPDNITTPYDVQGEVVRELTSIETGQFTSPYLPTPFAPEAVTGLSGRWTWDPATLTIKAEDTTSRNQQYVVFSSIPRLTAASLARATARPEGVPSEFLQVPANLPDSIRQTAGNVAGSGSPFAKALAIQQYLRSPEFSYSLQAPVQNGYDGNGISVLADFLEEKSGYCVHFSSAMAVMARLQGIPSRIAIGYAPGRPTGETVALAGQGAFPEFEVDARDAHAWPELYFEGLGWVSFEPTQSRGVVPDYATPASTSSGSGTNSADEILPTLPLPAPSAPTVPVPPAAQGTQTGDTTSWTVLYASALTIFLVLAVSSPRLVRAGIRARRLGGNPAFFGPDRRRGSGGAALAWAELQDVAEDYGIKASPSESPRQFSARLRDSRKLSRAESLNEQGRAAVRALTRDFERLEFGRPAEESDAPAWERIAAVRAALRANSSLWVRLRADWLPPSVMARWSALAASPFQPLWRERHNGAELLGRALVRFRRGLDRITARRP